jgi:hypothetical protein
MMLFDPTTLAFTRAVAFKGVALSQRRLQEKGMSPIGTYRLKRYVLLPAIVWCLIFVRPSDISYILQYGNLPLFIILIPLIHELQELIFTYIVNTTNSVSACTVLTKIFSLPLLLVVGTFFNHDIPSIISVLAIALLVLAFAIQPTNHKNNKRTRFSRPLGIVLALVLLQTSLEAINFGFVRETLKYVEPQIYIGVYTLITTLILITWTSFLPKNRKDGIVAKKNRVQTASNPALWFVGEIAQTFSQAALPIYTLVSIGNVTFIMDVLSDLRQKRIKFTVHTASFMTLFMVGLSLAVYSAR